MINKTEIMKTPFNRFLYIGFVLIGIFQAAFSKDFMQAASSFGIALAFDPFNTDQKWNDRPLWQKIVLIIHLSVLAGLFGYTIGSNMK